MSQPWGVGFKSPKVLSTGNIFEPRGAMSDYLCWYVVNLQPAACSEPEKILPMHASLLMSHYLTCRQPRAKYNIKPSAAKLESILLVQL